MANEASNSNEAAFVQDLTGPEETALVFVIQLLMKEKCDIPEKSRYEAIMRKHFGEVECGVRTEDITAYAIKRLEHEYNGAKISPMLCTMPCTPFDESSITGLTRSQMWDCPEHDEVLSRCKYQVVATDMLAGFLSRAERAELVMDYFEALTELFPDCEAVLFANSGKLFNAATLAEHNPPRENRFLYYAVNVRFFNIAETDDMLVDTLGLKVLDLPDLQYHYHDLDPNDIVMHAYSFASYIFASDNPINDGDCVDGFAQKDGSYAQWKCHYEDALVQPPRPVLDVCTNEFSAGDR